MAGPGLAMALLSKKPEAEDEPPEDESGEESGAPFDDVAQEAFDAIKNGDVDTFKSALKAAVQVCMADYDKD